MTHQVFPQREKIGLYDPAFEHDACGVAFVARLDDIAALAALAALAAHRTS